MNQHIFKGQWNQIKGKLKQQWGRLNDEQLTEIEGNNESIYGFLEKEYGYTKEKAKAQVEAFLKNNADPLQALEIFVQENALLSLGAAFGVGILLGVFLKC